MSPRRRRFLIAHSVLQALMVSALSVVSWPLILLLINTEWKYVVIAWLIVIPIQTIACFIVSIAAAAAVGAQSPEANKVVRLGIVLSLPSYLTLAVVTVLFLFIGMIAALGAAEPFMYATIFAGVASVGSLFTLVIALYVFVTSFREEG